jgi:hypothetical protein
VVRSTRLPVALLALAGAMVVVGLIAYGNTQHLACDDTEDPVMRQLGSHLAVRVAGG